jgi:hypothetical protein
LGPTFTNIKHMSANPSMCALIGYNIVTPIKNIHIRCNMTLNGNYSNNTIISFDNFANATGHTITIQGSFRNSLQNSIQPRTISTTVMILPGDSNCTVSFNTTDVVLHTQVIVIIKPESNPSFPLSCTSTVKYIHSKGFDISQSKSIDGIPKGYALRVVNVSTPIYELIKISPWTRIMHYNVNYIISLYSFSNASYWGCCWHHPNDIMPTTADVTYDFFITEKGRTTTTWQLGKTLTVPYATSLNAFNLLNRKNNDSSVSWAQIKTRIIANDRKVFQYVNTRANENREITMYLTIKQGGLTMVSPTISFWTYGGSGYDTFANYS